MNKPHLRYRNQTTKERYWTIHLIAAFKVFKGLLMLFIGIKLLTLFNHDVAEWFMNFVNRHGINPENKYVVKVLEKVTGIGNTQIVFFSIGAFLYSVLQFVEGIGLWLEKRWAELLTVVATSLLIPFELYELYEKFTFVRLVILFVNLFVVWYLATRLKDEAKEISHNDKN
nr:ion transport protein N-terminal [uncultured bacterium]